MLALSGTAAGAQRAQIRPTRVKEGGSDTAKRCFRGPHELAFIRSKIFIYPQFASSAKRPPLSRKLELAPLAVTAALGSMALTVSFWSNGAQGRLCLCGWMMRC